MVEILLWRRGEGMRVQLRFVGGGGRGTTIEKIPDLWWLVEHIDIRSQIPVQIVAYKAQHMCYTFIHSFTYCTLHVGLLVLDILHLHHMCHTYIYICSHITCATNSFIHSDRHMCYAYINSCSHITCATHSFIHTVIHTRSALKKYVSHNFTSQGTPFLGKFSFENSDPWKL